MRNRTIALAVGLSLALSGCYSYQASTAPLPQTAVASNQRVRLTRTDGSTVELRNAFIRGDSIVGIDVVSRLERSVATDKVRKVETGKLEPGRTAAAVVGGAAVTAAAAYAVVLLIVADGLNSSQWH